MDMIKISDLIEKLVQYKGLEVYKNLKVGDLISTLEQTDNSVLNLNNIDSYLPEWKTMSLISFNFEWCRRYSSMDIYILIEYNDGEKINTKKEGIDKFDELIYKSEFSERLDSIGKDYSLDYCRSLFSKELLQAFSENNVKLVIPIDYEFVSY